MKLRYSPTSPYVRKVRVVALERGLADPELLTVDTWNLPQALLDENPLGKVPALITDEGEVLYDSPVICEYLDALKPGSRLFPAEGPARWRALRLQALGDGMMDASVERYVELMRPETLQMDSWALHQKRGVDRALDRLECTVEDVAGALTIGSIAVACALGYLDLRFAADQWRDQRSILARWYDAFSQRPSMQATRPPAA